MKKRTLWALLIFFAVTAWGSAAIASVFGSSGMITLQNSGDGVLSAAETGAEATKTHIRKGTDIRLFADEKGRLCAGGMGEYYDPAQLCFDGAGFRLSGKYACVTVEEPLKNAKIVFQRDSSAENVTLDSQNEVEIYGKIGTLTIDGPSSVTVGAAAQVRNIFVRHKSAKLTLENGAQAEYVHPYGEDTAYEGDAAYTIMVLLNGTDLETVLGMGTADLKEMIDAGLPDGAVNIIVQTMGTKRWKLDAIPDSQCARFRLDDGRLELIEALGELPLSDPDNLADFISYCIENYPAKRSGLLLWNHGGGPNGGFGVDALAQSDGSMALSLPALASGLKRGLNGKKLEFVGFDACLMATAEVANALSSYADYLYASQEAEPGNGWDYTVWLNWLGRNLDAGGKALGKAALDSYIQHYDDKDDSRITFSITDLSKAKTLASALGGLGTDMARLAKSDFAQLITARVAAREFNNTSRSTFDLVDIASLADALSESPAMKESVKKVQSALKAAVLYHGEGELTDPACGLSVYFPYYGNKNIDDATGKSAMETTCDSYEKTGFDPRYITFVREVSKSILNTSHKITLGTPVNNQNGFFNCKLLEGDSYVKMVRLVIWQKVPEMPDYGIGDSVYRQVFCDEERALNPDSRKDIWASFDGRFYFINGELAVPFKFNFDSTGKLGLFPLTRLDAKGNRRDYIDVEFCNEYEQADYGTLSDKLRMLSAQYSASAESYGGAAPKQTPELKKGDVLHNDTRWYDLSKPDETLWYFDREELYTLKKDGGLDIEYRLLDENDTIYGKELYFTFVVTDYWNNEYYAQPQPINYSAMYLGGGTQTAHTGRAGK